MHFEWKINTSGPNRQSVLWGSEEDGGLPALIITHRYSSIEYQLNGAISTQLGKAKKPEGKAAIVEALECVRERLNARLDAIREEVEGLEV